MYEEQKFEYEIQLVGNDFNEYGMIKPSTYQNMIQYVAECHLKRLNLDTDIMSASNLAWVLTGMTIEVQNPPKGCDILIGKTWHSQTKGPYFRREFMFLNQDGLEVFCGASFSVLIDLQKRSILRHFTLPIEIDGGNGEFVLGGVKPAFKENEQYDFCEIRKVYNSYMDILGHVNNTRYCEFAFDTLTNEEKSREIRRVAINFVSELQKDDTFAMHKGWNNNTTYLKGVREEDKKKSFDVAFTFAE